LTRGTHYTVTNVGLQVRIYFTPAGIALLNSDPVRNGNQQVQAGLTTEVIAVGVDGIIPNQAWLFPSNQAIVEFDRNPTDPTRPDNPFPPTVSPVPDTRWGGIDVHKTSAATLQSLAGAQYQVFNRLADETVTAAHARISAGAVPVVVSGAPVHSNGGSVWTTGEDGRVQIDGLRRSTNTNPGHEHPGFWLVEVTAPNGYELLAQPIQFDVSTVIDGVIDINVVNVPHNAGFRLPLTGGDGARNFGIIALVVAAGGIGAVTYRRRKVAHAETVSVPAV
jgi:LPXTG-motif cell wall-anchored protein